MSVGRRGKMLQFPRDRGYQLGLFADGAAHPPGCVTVSSRLGVQLWRKLMVCAFMGPPPLLHRGLNTLSAAGLSSITGVPSGAWEARPMLFISKFQTILTGCPRHETQVSDTPPSRF